MPSFDLRGIRVAAYTNTAGVVSYATPASMGDAMDVQIKISYAEGRLYAEGKKAEYKKLVSGGTISIGTKYIPDAVQNIMYGSTADSQAVTVEGTQSTVSGVKVTGKDINKYVGIGFYAPDVIDGADKYTACFVSKCSFGQPDMVYKTKDDKITFQTPTTTGEFMPDDSADQDVMVYASCASAAEAEAWITAKFAA